MDGIDGLKVLQIQELKDIITVMTNNYISDSDKLKRSLDPENPMMEKYQELFSLAIHIFGSNQGAFNWFRDEVYSLGGVRPIDIMDTEEGIESIKNILYAITYGNYM